MDKIYILQRFVARENNPAIYDPQVLYYEGFYTSKEMAAIKMAEYLKGHGFEYQITDDGKFVTSENVFYAIITLENHDY